MADVWVVQAIAPCEAIRIPGSKNVLLLECGILGVEIQNPTLGIQNPARNEFGIDSLKSISGIHAVRIRNPAPGFWNP